MKIPNNLYIYMLVIFGLINTRGANAGESAAENIFSFPTQDFEIRGIDARRVFQNLRKINGEFIFDDGETNINLSRHASMQSDFTDNLIHAKINAPTFKDTVFWWPNVDKILAGKFQFGGTPGHQNQLARIVVRYFMLRPDAPHTYDNLRLTQRTNDARISVWMHENHHLENSIKLQRVVHLLDARQILIALLIDEASALMLFHDSEPRGILCTIQSGQALDAKKLRAIARGKLNNIFGNPYWNGFYSNNFKDLARVRIRRNLLSDLRDDNEAAFDQLLDDMLTYNINGKTIRLSEIDPGIVNYVKRLMKKYINNYQEIIQYLENLPRPRDFFQTLFQEFGAEWFDKQMEFWIDEVSGRPKRTFSQKINRATQAVHANKTFVASKNFSSKPKVKGRA